MTVAIPSKVITSDPTTWIDISPQAHKIRPCWISVAVSAIVGYAVIAFFLRYLQTRTLKIFVYYRIVFGIVVIVLAFLPWGSAR